MPPASASHAGPTLPLSAPQQQCWHDCALWPQSALGLYPHVKEFVEVLEKSLGVFGVCRFQDFFIIILEK